MQKYEASFDLVQKYDLDLTYFVDFCLDALLNAVKQVEKKVDFLIKNFSLKDQMNINVNQVCIMLFRF